jgi:hypothetical protein
MPEPFSLLLYLDREEMEELERSVIKLQPVTRPTLRSRISRTVHTSVIDQAWVTVGIPKTRGPVNV